MMEYSEKEEDNDILPDTNIDRERTLTGKWALAIMVIYISRFRFAVDYLNYLFNC